jgi:hypothetical protein
MPTVVQVLTERREVQDQERATASVWKHHEGERLSIVFTTPAGGLVLRQTVAELIKQGAKAVGIVADVGTHADRRSVVTTLFVDGDEALEDIARFVGHAKPSWPLPADQDCLVSGCGGSSGGSNAAGSPTGGSQLDVETTLRHAGIQEPDGGVAFRPSRSTTFMPGQRRPPAT